MALKSDRLPIFEDISGTCESVASPGVGLVIKTSGSGVAMGDSAALYDLVTDPSGYKFAGVLLASVVNIDQTRFHRNFLKDEYQIGMKVPVGKIGRWTTDKISGSPTAGDVAYLTTSGAFTPTKSATGGVAATPRCGVFHGAKDEDGFATIDFDINLNTSI